MSITRTQFPDFLLEDALPALRAVTFDEYERYPMQYPKIFNVESSDRAIEQFSQITSFGLMAEAAEGEPLTYDELLQGFDKTYKHRKFQKGYCVTQEMIDDDKHRIAKSAARALGLSARETKEIEAALVLNRAFNGSFTGPDGVALCSTAHPKVGGGTQANRPTVDADLDIPGLEIALQTFRRWTDHRGKKIRVVPTTLVVAPENEFVAARILGGEMEAFTADNNVNPFRHRAQMKSLRDYFVYDYLTDPDAWFLICEVSHPEYGLTFFDRKKFYTESEGDFDMDGMKTAGRMRFSVGWHNWIGLYGSPGS